MFLKGSEVNGDVSDVFFKVAGQSINQSLPSPKTRISDLLQMGHLV